MGQKTGPLKPLLDLQKHVIKKLGFDDPKLFVLRLNKSSCVLCSLSSALFFIGDNISADRFKDEITSSLKANYRLKFAQDMELNCVREKGKPQCRYTLVMDTGTTEYWLVI